VLPRSYRECIDGALRQDHGTRERIDAIPVRSSRVAALCGKLIERSGLPAEVDRSTWTVTLDYMRQPSSTICGMVTRGHVFVIASPGLGKTALLLPADNALELLEKLCPGLVATFRGRRQSEVMWLKKLERFLGKMFNLNDEGGEMMLNDDPTRGPTVALLLDGFLEGQLMKGARIIESLCPFIGFQLRCSRIVDVLSSEMILRHSRWSAITSSRRTSDTTKFCSLRRPERGK